MGFFNWFKKKLNGNKSLSAREEFLLDQWAEHKNRLMEKSLGEEFRLVLHSIIPYAIGGALDLYYYPNGIEGTAVATQELSELPDQGPSNRVFRTYELVMFTRHLVTKHSIEDGTSTFGQIHTKLRLILNHIARYTSIAELNDCETCEFPIEMEDVGGTCLMFSAYAIHNDHLAKNFGLLAIIEIFRSEMNYAMENGGGKLIEKLKEKNYYPYSDLDRQPVV